MFQRLLIANRGEIACRVISTAKKLGIHTIAIYSQADANSRHVRLAHEAHYVGPSASKESYLQQQTILDIAKQTRADAIHPGYGFLSENAEFARLCQQHQIIFVGPPASAIDAMGLKNKAKEIMEKSGVPVIPGYHGKDQTPATLLSQAKVIGFPVLLKAAAGGGGKGMRVVHHEQEFSQALAGAKREAQNAFGNDEMIIEKFLTKPRHIEMQIFADTHGQVVHLFERDCSIQRRHQKIIEEAPAPGLSDDIRKKMGAAAVAAAQAIHYVGAGTIEFLLEGDDFYFMEMNTRLQVEHPVTEMIVGEDLVAWQLQIAAQMPLPKQQNQITKNGHAIEVRIYAEDCDNNFLPSIGKIDYLSMPESSQTVRIDSGVAEGDNISMYYDPMIAKLIVHADNRELAINKMQQALSQYHLLGVITNINFLQKILRHPTFFAADLSTKFLDNHLDQLLNQTEPATTALAFASVFRLLQQQKQQQDIAQTTQDPYSPWANNPHWRIANRSLQNFKFLYKNEEFNTEIKQHEHNFLVNINQQSLPISLENFSNNILVLLFNQQRIAVTALSHDQQIFIAYHDKQFTLQCEPLLSLHQHTEENSGHLCAPMPGTVVAIMTKANESVERGQSLIVMEAMKMEHTICAPSAGKIINVHFKVGDQVEEGIELIAMELAE